MNKSDKYSISMDSCSIGFEEHFHYNPFKPLSEQLNRRFLYHRANRPKGEHVAIKKIIESNASLRVSYGWSFESTWQMSTVFDEIEQIVHPKYNCQVNQIISDTRGDWFGFLPFNAFEKEMLDDLSLYSLIEYNNDLMNFQIEVIDYFISHPLFKQHMLIRDDKYRFTRFKEVRKDSAMLTLLYREYIDSLINILGHESFPKDIIDMEIGCHFVYNPELYFELMNFSVLKGELYE